MRLSSPSLSLVGVRAGGEETRRRLAEVPAVRELLGGATSAADAMGASTASCVLGGSSTSLGNVAPIPREEVGATG